jgi:hypothetical protein
VLEKAQDPSAQLSVRAPKWVRHAFSDAPEIIQHTIALVLSVLSIWCVHKVFALLLGPNAMFYDRIPIKWAFDTAHVAVFLRFLWKLVRSIWKS